MPDSSEPSIDARAAENIQRLVDELAQDHAELAKDFPHLNIGDLAKGRAALEQALAVIRKLEQALQKGSL